MLAVMPVKSGLRSYGDLPFTSYGGLQDLYTDEFQKLAGSKKDLAGVKVVK